MHAQIACHHLGEFAGSQRPQRSGRFADTTDVLRRTSLMMFDPVAASLAESSRNCWITGYLARDAGRCRRGCQKSGRELRHPDSLAFAWCFTGGCTASVETGRPASHPLRLALPQRANRTLCRRSRGTVACMGGDWRTPAGSKRVPRNCWPASTRAPAIMGQVALPQLYA